MRVVLDTNVILSASMKPDGLEARVVEMAISGALEAWVTSEILEEYREVLLREKFRAFSVRSNLLLLEAERRFRRVEVGERLAVASDEDDNRFLECAEAAQAEFLITGNLRHYPEKYKGTRMLNARAFTEIVDGE